MRKSIARFLGVAAVAVLSAGAAYGQQSLNQGSVSAPALKAAFGPVVSLAAESVVQVKVANSSAVLGTVIDARGYIVTKASEIKDPVTVRLRDGREFDAKIVATRMDLDIACLKIDPTGLKPADLKAVVFADSPTIAVGEWVAAPGMPDKPVLSVGIVSTPRRKISGKPGMLGVTLVDDTTGAAPAKGVKIRTVLADSPAAHAGLRVDDVILKINGVAPTDSDSLRTIIKSYEPNEEVTLTIGRNGREQDLKATLAGEEIADPLASMQSQEEKYLSGTVSKRATNFPAVIQNDVVLRPYDCGGPLVDLEGRVLGINIARAGRTESYAIPGDLIMPILRKLDAAAAEPATQPAREKAVSTTPENR